VPKEELVTELHVSARAGERDPTLDHEGGQRFAPLDRILGAVDRALAASIDDVDEPFVAEGVGRTRCSRWKRWGKLAISNQVPT
jgi:hypothetical protein